MTLSCYLKSCMTNFRSKEYTLLSLFEYNP